MEDSCQDPKQAAGIEAIPIAIDVWRQPITQFERSSQRFEHFAGRCVLRAKLQRIELPLHFRFGFGGRQIETEQK